VPAVVFSYLARHQSNFGSYRKDLYIFGQEICVNPPPAPPQYPGSSTDRRVCLEGTRKNSTASGASRESLDRSRSCGGDPPHTLPADELKGPLATSTDPAMSWSKQHTAVRRCGDHNEHPLQHHNAHCTAEEGGRNTQVLPPRQQDHPERAKQKQMAHIRRSSKHRRGSSSAWARQLHHIPAAAGWTRPGAGIQGREEGRVEAPRRNLVRPIGVSGGSRAIRFQQARPNVHR
jgi:hypothetical protein